MNINRLLNNTENTLTKAQRDKIRPILQELNKTSNHSLDVLQKSADDINAVLTDKQRSFLATPSGGINGDTQVNAQAIYRQVLDSLK